ncbi:MAG: DUF2127 domain-containing protein [Solirubrobacterales bacterium]
MKKLLNKETALTISFYGGLAIKALNAVIEFIAGFLMLILSHDMLNNLIWLAAFAELSEDPKDMLMNYLIKLGNNLSINTQHSAGLYMLLHGSTKLIVIWLLINRKLWAYPAAVAIFGLFVAYEIHGFFYSHSILMLILIIIDITIMIIILLEYKRLKIKMVNK